MKPTVYMTTARLIATMLAVLAVLALCFLILTMRDGFAYAAESPPHDITEGTVAVFHVSDKRLKVGIRKAASDETQYYDYTSGESVAYPLPLGNGTYTVSIYEQVEGSRYRRVDTYDTELKLEDENAVFCSRIQDIFWRTDGALAQKAAGLTYDKSGTEQKAMALYTYITDNYRYNGNAAESRQGGGRASYIPVPEKTFGSGDGMCYDLAALYAAMCRSVGIPCKLIKGYCGEQYHAWNSVYDEESDEWIELDVTNALGVVRLFPGRYDRINAGDYLTDRYY